MPRVVALVDPHDFFESRGYIIKFLAERWRARGIDFVVNKGPALKETGDLALLHVDRTVVPRSYVDLARAYPRALNAAAVDIGKQHIPDGRVTMGDGYDGPVIVKTALNHYGFPERAARRAALPKPLRRLIRGVDAALDHSAWWITARVPTRVYPRFARAADVPRTVWRDPRFIVQRYVVEREGPWSMTRRWTFFGSAGANFLARFDGPTPARSANTQRIAIDPPPPEIVAARARFGVDFGSIDYVMDNGVPLLFDVNKTVVVVIHEPSYVSRLVDALASGIDEFV